MALSESPVLISRTFSLWWRRWQQRGWQRLIDGGMCVCMWVCVREVPCISKNVHCVAFSENQKQIMDNKMLGIILSEIIEEQKLY